ncbi:histidine phosphatase family protein [soil metagenome]|jgi:probable phosphoglycerate mutase
MAATIYLLRHAVTEATGTRLGGRTQAALSDKGRGQAQVTRDHLHDVDFKAVYASPLPRTTETAQIIAKPHRLKVRPAEGVIEVDYGKWTDRPLKPLYKNKLWPVIQQTPSLVTFPDGESMRGAQDRAVSAVEEIAGRHNNKIVAVVSHADIIKMVLAFYSGMPLDTFQRLMVNPASVSIISTGKGVRPTVLSINHVPYRS